MNGGGIVNRNGSNGHRDVESPQPTENDNFLGEGIPPHAVPAVSPYSSGVKNMFFICFAIFFISLYAYLMNRSSNNAQISDIVKLGVSQVKRSSYTIGIITDLDKRSAITGGKPQFKAYLRLGKLSIQEKKYSITWDSDLITYVSGHNEEGRGMECSELTYYNGKLYSGDDRTGLLYQLTNPKEGGLAIPKFTFMEGNGMTNKGLKIEWSTVKDDKMYIGSFGKEYTNKDGSVKNLNNLWVKVVDKDGYVDQEDWTDRYALLRSVTHTSFPNGYMIHEAVEWSQIHRKWFILPRRVSETAYDEEMDESKGSNTVLIVNEAWDDVQVLKITTVTPARGFSSFKFLPGSHDEIIVALKSEENEKLNKQSSYLVIFNINGEILLNETEIDGGFKYEGLEFLDDWLHHN